MFVIPGGWGRRITILRPDKATEQDPVLEKKNKKTQWQHKKPYIKSSKIYTKSI
jgi:hypothetical protein